MKHKIGSTARLIHAAKTLVQHGTPVFIVCNDELHQKMMETNYPEIPGLNYVLWQQIPDRSYQTMQYNGRQLFFDHYTIEQRLGHLIDHYESLAKRRTCDL